MPNYSTICRIQTPSLTDLPDVTNATAPPAIGVERDCMMIFMTSDDRDAAIVSPTEGLTCYIDDEDDHQIFTEGVWKSAVPRFIQLYTTTLPNTAEVAVATFKVRGASRYWARWVVHFTQSTGGIFLRCQTDNEDNYFYLESNGATGADNVSVGENFFDTKADDFTCTVWGSRTTASGTGSHRYGILQLWKVR